MSRGFSTIRTLRPCRTRGGVFPCACPLGLHAVYGSSESISEGLLPAVTHVDGTARVQTVTREANPRFYDLLATFGRLTGVPVLLNTSFNVQEPIVCSPDEAVRCFQRTQVDWLVLGNLLVGRPSPMPPQHHEG